jgi:hypothetical protein
MKSRGFERGASKLTAAVALVVASLALLESQSAGAQPTETTGHTVRPHAHAKAARRAQPARRAPARVRARPAHKTEKPEHRAAQHSPRAVAHDDAALGAAPAAVEISPSPPIAEPRIADQAELARTPSTALAPAPSSVRGLPPRPSLRALRAPSPPVIDGALDEEAWRAAPPSAAFTQKVPSDGGPPSDQTSLRLLYDDDALYVAFDCQQQSSPIVALLARRDRPTETDSVAVAFDSRSEGRSAFEFSVNAAGVQLDGIRFDDGKLSREWDGIWEAKTAVREGGWTAEFRIPLQVLRFDAGDATAWKFQARRYISAKQEIDEWAYIPRDTGGEVSHYGQIEELQLANAHSSLELQPFVLARAQHQTPDPALVGSGWRVRPSAGLDFKWHPDDNVVLDGTINPDFGQVEADRLILNLTTVELAFPEKRPFFLSGMDDFSMLTPIFYSRRIGRTPNAPPLSPDPRSAERLYEAPQPAPLYGALKLAADLGDTWTVAALSALTGPNEVAVVSSNGAQHARLLDPLTSYNVLRVRGEFAPGLDIGLTGTATVRNEPGFGWPAPLTSRAEYLELPAVMRGSPSLLRCPQGELTASDERCFHNAYVASTDMVWRSASGDYALRAQAYGSAIEAGPTRMLPDGTQIASGDLGAGGTLRLSKQGGEHWLVDATVAAHSRKLDFNDLGFMDRQNYSRAGAYLEYRTLEPWLSVLETHTSALAYGENSLDGLALGRGLMLMEDIVLDSRWGLTLAGYATAARFDDREVGDGTALERAAVLGAVQAFTSDPRRAWVLSSQLAEEGLHAGFNLNAQVGLTWRPLSFAELQVAPAYTYNFGEPRYAGTGQSSNDLVFGRLLAESLGLTLRAALNFLPTLTLQTYGQLFLAQGHYFDYAHLTAPASGPRPVVRLADLTPGSPPPTLPDFERASLAINVVLRWEYHLGSTLYLVYVRSQSPSVVVSPGQVPRLDLNGIRNAAASDVFMLKVSYWFG